MTKDFNTDFESISSYEAEHSPSLANQETVEEYPNSEMVKGECPHRECGFSGTAIMSYGWNSYYRCPKCGKDTVVVG